MVVPLPPSIPVLALPYSRIGEDGRWNERGNARQAPAPLQVFHWELNPLSLRNPTSRNHPPVAATTSRVLDPPRSHHPPSRTNSHNNYDKPTLENAMATQSAMPTTTAPAPAPDAPFIKDFSGALRAHRAERARCAEVLKSISEACRADHGKAHTFECAPCHQTAVEEIRRRYLGPKAGDASEEWFAGREDFLGELAQMLDGARERRVPLGDVDARIEGEKRRWYRDVLRTYPFFVTSAIESVGADNFRAALVAGTPEDEIADLVRKGTAPLRGGPIDAETYIALSDPSTSNDDLARLLFETDAGKIPDGAEPYADLLRAGTPLEHLITTMARDTTPWTPTAPDLEATFQRARDERAARRAEAREARRRLDELERARAAHKKIQTARTEERDRRLRGELFEVPGCGGCGGRVGEGGARVVACTLCQVLVDMGVRKAQTVYCSVKCHGDAHVSLSFAPLNFLCSTATVAAVTPIGKKELTHRRNPTSEIHTPAPPAKPVSKTTPPRPRNQPPSAENASPTPRQPPTALRPARPPR